MELHCYHVHNESKHEHEIGNGGRHPTLSERTISTYLKPRQHTHNALIPSVNNGNKNFLLQGRTGDMVTKVGVLIGRC